MATMNNPEPFTPQTRAAPENELLQDYVARAADGIEQVTEYFRRKDASEIVHDVERFARREPALFLGGAFALGLLGARFLKSRSREPFGLDVPATVGAEQQAPRPDNLDPYPQQHIGVVEKPAGSR